MKLVFLIFDQGDVAGQALALVKEQHALGHEVAQIFLYGDGCGLPVSLEGLAWSGWAEDKGLDILVCASHAERLGLKDQDIVHPFEIAGLGQWVKAVEACDQMWVFGDKGPAIKRVKPVQSAPVRYGFIISSDNHDRAIWGLNMALAAAAYDKPVVVLFRGDGLSLLQKPPGELAILQDLGVRELYAIGQNPGASNLGGAIKEIAPDLADQIIAQTIFVEV